MKLKMKDLMVTGPDISFEVYTNTVFMQEFKTAGKDSPGGDNPMILTSNRCATLAEY